MATKAALKAIEQAKISPKEIDLILVATATPDMLFPATACFVQKKIGANDAACLDISAACAGFVAPMTWRRVLTASSRSRAMTMMGPSVMNLTRPS